MLDDKQWEDFLELGKRILECPPEELDSLMEKINATPLPQIQSPVNDRESTEETIPGTR